MGLLTWLVSVSSWLSEIERRVFRKEDEVESWGGGNGAFSFVFIDFMTSFSERNDTWEMRNDVMTEKSSMR